MRANVLAQLLENVTAEREPVFGDGSFTEAPRASAMSPAANSSSFRALSSELTLM